VKLEVSFKGLFDEERRGVSLTNLAKVIFNGRADVYGVSLFFV
jgi:hypothetical protein